MPSEKDTRKTCFYCVFSPDPLAASWLLLLMIGDSYLGSQILGHFSMGKGTIPLLEQKGSPTPGHIKVPAQAICTAFYGQGKKRFHC